MGIVTTLSGRILDFEKINVKREELAEKKRADEVELMHRREALQLEREKFAARFCEIIRSALTDAKARDLVETNAPNAQLIAHMRQTYFSDIDALEKSGAVKLPG
jgi:predicted RNA-binding protein